MIFPLDQKNVLISRKRTKPLNPIMMKKLLFASLLMSVLVWSCSDQGPDYSGLLTGTWINTQADSVDVPTDAAFVMDYRADGVQMYAVGSALDAKNKTWTEQNFYRYRLRGNTITVTGNDVSGDYYMEFEILGLDQTTLTYSVKEFKTGKVEHPDTLIYTCKKAGANIKDQLAGIWYGHSITPNTSDSAIHYLDYRADGSFSYYYQDQEGKWLKEPDHESRYFIYGNFLVNVYRPVLSDGSFLTYDCWDIELNGNQLISKNLRKDGSIQVFEWEKADKLPDVN